MDILVAVSRTGLGNKIQFISVVKFLAGQSNMRVFCDDPIYNYLEVDNVELLKDHPVIPEVIYVPFGYNWKSLWRLKIKYPFSTIVGYKYRIRGLHIGWGYNKSFRFDETKSEIEQNKQNFIPNSQDDEFLHKNVDSFKRYGKSVAIHYENRQEKDLYYHEMNKIIRFLIGNDFLVFFIAKKFELGELDYPHEFNFDSPNFKKFIDYPLSQVIGILSDCQYYIGGDTGIMHLADYLGLSCVVFFNNTDPVKNGSVSGMNIRSQLWCSPCYNWGRVKCIHPIPFSCKWLSSFGIQVDDIFILMKKADERNRVFKRKIME